MLFVALISGKVMLFYAYILFNGFAQIFLVYLLIKNQLIIDSSL